jgi:hypothetical protein
MVLSSRAADDAYAFLSDNSKGNMIVPGASSTGFSRFGLISHGFEPATLGMARGAA